MVERINRVYWVFESVKDREGHWLKAFLQILSQVHLMIFQSRALRNFENSSNMVNIWQKK